MNGSTRHDTKIFIMKLLACYPKNTDHQKDASAANIRIDDDMKETFLRTSACRMVSLANGKRVKTRGVDEIFN